MAKLNFTDTESDMSDGDDTDYWSNHPNFDNFIESFDKTNIEFLTKLYFHINILKFFLCCIRSYDDKITAMKNKVDENPFNPRYIFLISVPF